MAEIPIGELAVALLLATVASAAIVFAILAGGWRGHAYSAAAGLAAGVVLRLTPAGESVAAKAEGIFQWIGQPLLGALFAVGFSVLAHTLLSSKLPPFGRIRRQGRRALRASRWGTAEEIGELSGVDAGIVALLGVAVDAPEPSQARLLTRLRISANVACGSCLGLFFIIARFRDALWENLTWTHALINLAGTAFVTFFIGPLHEEVLHLTAPHPEGHPEPGRAEEANGDGRPQLWRRLAIFALVAVLLFLLQAVHSAAHEVLRAMTLYDWIVLLELCALPVIVTTYYFGVALHHEALGNHRWDRALGASIWFGAIVLVPFALAALLADAFTPELRASLIGAVTDPGANSFRLLVLGCLIAFVSVLMAIAIATVASFATYGVYALGLGLAMTDATAANARFRCAVGIVIAGVVVQGITSGAAYWWDLGLHQLHYAHIVLAIGWAGGLYLSRFDREMGHVATPPASS